ncbi:3-oxoacyl-ACP reductase [Bermanella marisrubri]|uniref:3-ketoacyl-(Acyl-carrier-protein) reductase n=1 Tax=Bermanella marisrubri TaxID=207949 RepID=Q1N194_9GAMM|nr:3-oxoacyl-ACP reductase [Bermanella marisrubri]EAT11957.1 3-ketoacyl-(acyl-carrier-protein) reductase [Oceanobacter sp. RED65] [Bermanella marisrubri]QIZ84761.1 3-oxoacyl-ACP reductase [Bermanella marisrubri]
MSSMIERLFYSKVGQGLLSAMGVKPPVDLPRFAGEIPWVKNTVAMAEPAQESLARVLHQCGINHEVRQADKKYDAHIFDACQLQTSADLKSLYDDFSKAANALNPTAKVLIIGRNPERCDSAEQASVMSALNGFTRSLAKELGRKAIYVNLLYVDQDITDTAASSINFLLSARAAYVTGQPLIVNQHSVEEANWQQPLAGKTALVTGAAQGIGAAIAKTLHRDGAHIIGLDIPQAEQALENTMSEVNGTALCLDITSDTAAEDIQQALKGEPLDILVHNAGVTRDKTIARMPEHFWDMAININLKAPMSINQALEKSGMFAEDARVICISSISGIAGNVGQTNYSASKSGIAGYVSAQSKQWQNSNRTVNAIAPGFIETQMTEQIPFMTREMGRRMNSLSQGGKPEDVAEAVAFFAQPASGSLNGQLLRVCGQSLLGA